MRDPKRIRKFLNKLADIWETYFPDLRFGQFIFCVFSLINTAMKDPFYIEDEEFLTYVQEFANTKKESDGI